MGAVFPYSDRQNSRRLPCFLAYPILQSSTKTFLTDLRLIAEQIPECAVINEDVTRPVIP